jgi:hypothetical protein
MAGDIEQLTAEKATRERATLAMLAIGLGSERMLHEEGITVDRNLPLDGDWGGCY